MLKIRWPGGKLHLIFQSHLGTCVGSILVTIILFRGWLNLHCQEREILSSSAVVEIRVFLWLSEILLTLCCGLEFSMQKSVYTSAHVLSYTSCLLDRNYQFLTLHRNLGALLFFLQHFKLHLGHLIECRICYPVETMGRWVGNMGVLLCDLWSLSGVSINVSGVLLGHLVPLFLYILCALGSISVFILTVLIKYGLLVSNLSVKGWLQCVSKCKSVFRYWDRLTNIFKFLISADVWQQFRSEPSNNFLRVLLERSHQNQILVKIGYWRLFWTCEIKWRIISI